MNISHINKSNNLYIFIPVSLQLLDPHTLLLICGDLFSSLIYHLSSVKLYICVYVYIYNVMYVKLYIINIKKQSSIDFAYSNNI